MLDKNLLFCEDLAVTVTANATDTFPLATLAQIKRERNGASMEVVVQVVEAFTAAGAATMVIGLSSGNSAALGSAAVQYASPAIGKAELIVGKKIILPLDFTIADADATHIGVAFTVATGPMTAGKVTAWIQPAGTDQRVF